MPRDLLIFRSLRASSATTGGRGQSVGAAAGCDLLILALLAAAARPDVASQSSSTATGCTQNTCSELVSRSFDLSQPSCLVSDYRYARSKCRSRRRLRSFDLGSSCGRCAPGRSLAKLVNCYRLYANICRGEGGLSRRRLAFSLRTGLRCCADHLANRFLRLERQHRAFLLLTRNRLQQVNLDVCLLVSKQTQQM